MRSRIRRIVAATVVALAATTASAGATPSTTSTAPGLGASISGESARTTLNSAVPQTIRTLGGPTVTPQWDWGDVVGTYRTYQLCLAALPIMTARYFPSVVGCTAVPSNGTTVMIIIRF